MIALGLFCAVAYIVTFVFHVKIGFLTFDAKDAVVCIASMIFGPLAGISVAAVTALLEFLTVSDTGLWGLLMNFASTACFAAITGVIYRYYRNLAGAIVGLVISVVASVSLMLLLNIFITPIYLDASISDVVKMIPKTLLPFNLVKYVNSAALVMLFYKPLSSLLKITNVTEREQDESGELKPVYKFGVKTVVVTALALLLCAGCVFLIIKVLGGSISFF